MFSVTMSTKYIILYEFNCPVCGKKQEFFSEHVYPKICADCGGKIRPLVGALLRELPYRRLYHFAGAPEK